MSTNIYPHHPAQQLASRLRKCTFLPEYKLWKDLSIRQPQYCFLRQHLIQNYIVDIFCPDLQLIIEIGGDVHDLKFGEENRYSTFEELGLRYLRFGNNEVKEDREEVIGEIGRFFA